MTNNEHIDHWEFEFDKMSGTIFKRWSSDPSKPEVWLSAHGIDKDGDRIPGTELVIPFTFPDGPNMHVVQVALVQCIASVNALARLAVKFPDVEGVTA